MNKKVGKTIIITLYSLCMLSYIWLDCTHTIRGTNVNYSPESFSLAYAEPLTWLCPLYGLGMLLLPWYWRLGFSTPGQSCVCSIYPCRKHIFSRAIAAIFSLLNAFVSFFAVVLTLCCLFLLGKWYEPEDIGLALMMYIFGGFIAMMLNLGYGLFLPRKWRRNVSEG